MTEAGDHTGAPAHDRDPALEPFRPMCAGTVERCSEGNRHFILMPGLHFPVRGQGVLEMDALLDLNHANAAYPTRLYLQKQIDGLNLNWHEHPYILGKPWHTWSWRGVPQNQAPIAILGAHLAAFK